MNDPPIIFILFHFNERCDSNQETSHNVSVSNFGFFLHRNQLEKVEQELMFFS
ncbi:hypothetical protein B14911_24546 [Bacillus sp. NRRL B-14911]|nr:hypothetical protein B14911_24546 [Bacillus sp. NRRL B-14911]